MPRKRERATPVEIPPGVTVTVGPALPLDRELKTRIDRDLHRLVKEAAAREDRSQAAIVRRALRAHLKGGADSG